MREGVKGGIKGIEYREGEKPCLGRRPVLEKESCLEWLGDSLVQRFGDLRVETLKSEHSIIFSCIIKSRNDNGNPRNLNP